VIAIVSWARGAGDFRQAVFADVDEVVEQLSLLTVHAVIQADQHAVQSSGQLLVIGRVHAHRSRAGKRSEQSASQPRPAHYRQTAA
jgi:hypothetical protein